jgi:uncharacterized membrane protein YphA (DoxX/SURF4 family)
MMQYSSALAGTNSKRLSKSLIIDVVSSLFVLLFAYTGISKLITIDGFAFVIGTSHMFGKSFRIIAWAVPLVELLVALSLLINKTRLWGLIASLGLMIIFDLYILYIILYVPNKPCQCGGVISKMTWDQHLVFNAFFTILAAVGAYMELKRRQVVAVSR